MSIKGIGSSGVLRPLEPLKKNNKKEEVKDFADSLKKAAVQKDSAQISGSTSGAKPQAMNNDYSSLAMLAVQNTAKQNAAQATVAKVLDNPEPFNQRVEEIKKLISEGGVEAYFRTIDSEKVAQKLLNSGILDDLI